MPIRPESVKRRTIWINDEDWAAMNAQARAADRNISVFIRETLRGLAEREAIVQSALPGPHVDTAAIARELEAMPNRFGKPRPAPKGGK